MRMLREVLRKAAAVIFPWPAKPDRAAAVAAAAREKDHSQAAAARARVVEQQIERMARENHFAAKIASQIMREER